MFRPTGLISFLVSERERFGSFGNRARVHERLAASDAKKGSVP